MKSRSIRIIGILMVLVSVFSLCACEITPLFETETTTEKVFTTTPIVGERERALEYFNDAVNALKGTIKPHKTEDSGEPTGEKPAYSYSIKRSASKFDCADKVLKANLSGLADKILGQKDKGDYNPVIVDENSPAAIDKAANYEAFNSKLPVNGEDWVSKLTIDDIKSIQWIDKNKTESKIVIYLGEEENPVKGEGIYGKIFNIADKDAILEEFKKTENYFAVEDYSTKYHDGKIVCTIDKETDRVIGLTYNKFVTVTAVGNGTNNLASLGEQTITFEYTEEFECGFNYIAVDGVTEATTEK